MIFNDNSANYLNITSKNNNQEDTALQCPLFQTMSNSNVCTNFLEVLEQTPRLEFKESKNNGQGLSELDRIFKDAGLSSQDYLSDPSGDIITIVEEDEEDDRSVEIITIEEEDEEVDRSF